MHWCNSLNAMLLVLFDGNGAKEIPCGLHITVDEVEFRINENKTKVMMQLAKKTY